MTADPSPSCWACKTALKDWCMDPDFLARRAVDNQSDEISWLSYLGLGRLAIILRVEMRETYRINSIAALLTPNKYCLSLTYAPRTSSRRSSAARTGCRSPDPREASTMISRSQRT